MAANALRAIASHEPDDQAADDWNQDQRQGVPAVNVRWRRHELLGNGQTLVVEEARKQSDQALEDESHQGTETPHQHRQGRDPHQSPVGSEVTFLHG